MPRKEHRDLVVTWPDEEAAIQLNVIHEEDEDPIDMTNQAIELASYYWGQEYKSEEEDKTSDFAEITYPEDIKVHYKNEEVSLDDLHSALETGIQEALRLALDRIGEEIERVEDITP